jgi:pimeloyl-ACP methyl ester carboxylesterase
MLRRTLLVVLLALPFVLAINTIATNNKTKPAKADIGRVLDLPDGDLQVREDGVRGKPTIVFLHGFAGSMHWWTAMVERPELRRSFRLIRIDLLGHGGSEKPDGGYSMEHQARQVALALRALKVKEAVIAGHSMGGVVATALAELQPKLVDGLILIGTPSNKDAGELPFTARLGFVPVLGQAIYQLVPDSAVRDNLEKAFESGFDVPDQFVEDFRRMTYTSYDDSHEKSGDYNESTPVSTRLDKLGKPLLVIQGADDELVDPDSARNYTRADANIILLPKTGHSPMVEVPELIAKPMAVFVRRSTGQPVELPQKYPTR